VFCQPRRRAWNERQAKRMPRLFSPTIGAAISARRWYLWLHCPACRTCIPWTQILSPGSYVIVPGAGISVTSGGGTTTMSASVIAATDMSARKALGCRGGRVRPGLQRRPMHRGATAAPTTILWGGPCRIRPYHAGPSRGLRGHPEGSTMTTKQYLAALQKLGLTPEALGLSLRQCQRIAAGQCAVPGTLARLLALMIACAGQE
jgi:hypothetical protein